VSETSLALFGDPTVLFLQGDQPDGSAWTGVFATSRRSGEVRQFQSPLGHDLASTIDELRRIVSSVAEGLCETRTAPSPRIAALPMPAPTALPARLASVVAAQNAQPPARMSEREVEVLALVADGLTNAGIAERLCLSPKTVSSHLVSIFGKLGVTSRASATRFAIEHGLT
jgi:DNA-binding NarL/FixJ family response regulator